MSAPLVVGNIDADDIVAMFLQMGDFNGKLKPYFPSEPTVFDGVEVPAKNNWYFGPTLSPSAMSTAEDCTHKWALQRLDNHPRQSSKSAERGGLLHTELESWLKTAKPPVVKGFHKVLQHFPAPGKCESETKFAFVFGRKDKEAVISGLYDAREPGIVYDLKTTGDFRWMKTPAQLEVDLQATVYAMQEMLRTGLKVVECRWVFALIKPTDEAKAAAKAASDDAEIPLVASNFEVTRVEVVSANITWERAIKTLTGYIPLIETMSEAIDKNLKAKDLDKNFDSCGAYGGCGWQGKQCIVPEGNKLFSLHRQTQEKLLQADTVKEHITTAQTPPPPQENPMTTTSAMSRFTKPAGAKPAAPAAPAPKPPAAAAAVAAAPVVASSAPATSSAAPAALMSRLSKLAPSQGAAIQQTAAGALQQDVQPRATGVVSPDAAKEWTAEEQDARAKEIEEGKKALKGAAALPEGSPTAAAAGEVAAEKAAAKPTTKGRGGRKATAAPAVEGTVTLKNLPEPGDVSTIQVTAGVAQPPVQVVTSEVFAENASPETPSDIVAQSYSGLSVQMNPEPFILLVNAAVLKGTVRDLSEVVGDAPTADASAFAVWLNANKPSGTFLLPKQLNPTYRDLLISRADLVIHGLPNF